MSADARQTPRGSSTPPRHGILVGMFPAWARIALAAAFSTIAALAARDGQFMVAAVGLALSGLMLAAWFRYHDIQKAARAFNEHDRARAWEVLESIPFGGRFLRREARIYYHHVRSLCLQRSERWADAAREAESAVRAAGARVEAPGCHLAAAQAYAHLGDTEAARRHAEAARSLPHNESVTKGLARVERQLAGA